jgi:hypothetical protein
LEKCSDVGGGAVAVNLLGVIVLARAFQGHEAPIAIYATAPVSHELSLISRPHGTGIHRRHRFDGRPFLVGEFVANDSSPRSRA